MVTTSETIADLFADALPTREEMFVNVAICGWLAVFIWLARETLEEGLLHVPWTYGENISTMKVVCRKTCFRDVL